MTAADCQLSMTKFSYLLAFLALFLCGPAICAQGTDETVHVEVAGTLSDLVLDLESSRIHSLTVTGQLSAPDIAFLNSGTGKLASTTTLDISNVTLVPGDEPYATVQIAKSDVGMGTTTATYYISDEYKSETESTPTMLGGMKVTMKVWCNDLSGAFALPKPNGTLPGYTEILLPESLPRIGDYIFLSNKNIQTVTLPANATSIGDDAFSGTTALEVCDLPTTLISIGKGSFASSNLSSVVFPSSLRTIGDRAFMSSKLSCSLDFSNVEAVGENAFYRVGITGELDLRKLTIIPDYAFYSGLYDSVIFSDQLISIGDQAFASSQLTDVTLPSSLQTLWASSFIGTPWQEGLLPEDGIIYINDIALKPTQDYNSENHVLTFKEGTKSIASGSWNIYLGSRKGYLKDIVTGLDLPTSLKEIGNNVFAGFTNIGDISLPEGLERIGDEAFNECSNLWFDDLPLSLTYIGRKAFKRCPLLTSVTIGENVRTVGTDAFSNCTGITQVKVYAKELVNSEYCGFGTLMGNDVTNLDKVTIGSQVTRLPEYMFGGCKKIRKVQFEERDPETPLFIDESCFSYCETAEFINFPERIDSIGQSAFEACRNLSAELLLKECKYIGKYAFQSCSALQTVTLPECLEHIGDDSFADTGLSTVNYYPVAARTEGGSPFRDCASISFITIGPETTLLDDAIFRGISNLKDVYFQQSDNSYTSKTLEIGKWAFANTGLEELELPQYTTSLGEYAFAWTSIKTMDIPASVKTMGTYLFNYSPLSSLHVYASTPPALEGYLMETSNYIKINVPEESIPLYEAAPYWSKYTYLPLYVPVEEIILNPDSWTGSLGEDTQYATFTIEATVLPENASDKRVVWKSSDLSVANVDNQGNVTVVGTGNCTITAESKDNPEITAHCNISVTTGLNEIACGDGELSDVYSVAGVLIQKAVDAQTLNNLQPGTYILRKGPKTEKVIIR